jgi:thymidine phosphorylase
MIAALGGPADLMEAPERHLTRAPLVRPVMAERAGRVARIDTREVGLAVVALGGGRTRPQDAVDPAVGLTELLPLGALVDLPQALALVHARDEAGFAEAQRRVRAAYDIGPEAGPVLPALVERVQVGAEGQPPAGLE